MKKLQFFIVLVLIGSLFSCNQKAGIKGEIQGLGNDTIFVHHRSISKFFTDDEPKIDTIYSQDGKFEYYPNIDELTLFLLVPTKTTYRRINGSLFAPQKLSLFLNKKENIVLSGKISSNNIVTYDVKGSNLNKECSALREKELQQLRKEIILLDVKLFDETSGEEFVKLFEQRNKLFAERRSKYVNYIKQNPKSQYSGFLVARYIGLKNFDEYYDLLNATVQKGKFAPMLSHLKAIWEAEHQITKGKQAPYFKLKTIQGKDFTLDAIMDKKYIVLDFWGSWCGACVRGFPKMKEYYQKYKDQIEIVGIDCKDTQEKWEKAVKDNQLPWIHVKNENTNVDYAVKGYPTKFILDKNHKIVGVFLGEGKDFYEELDELMKSKK